MATLPKPSRVSAVVPKTPEHELSPGPTKRTRLGLFLLSVLSLGLVWAPSATAQTTEGFSINRYEASERGSDWFSAESLDLRGELRPAFGVTADYGHKPLATYRNGELSQTLIQSQLFAHVGGALVLADRFRVGVSVPVALVNSGNDGTFAGSSIAKPTGVAVGDVRVGGDVRLVGAYHDAFTLAFGVQAFLPTGAKDAYTGDGKIRLLGRLMVAGDVDMFTYAATAGFMYRARNDDFAANTRGSEFTFSAAAGVRLMNHKLTIGPELYGSTVVENSGAFKKSTTPLELLLGAHLQAGDFRIGAGAGPGLSRGIGEPQFRALLSLDWAPAYEEPVAKTVSDKDGDGIPDDKDACIDLRGEKSADPTKNGCPGDKDGDGIYDKDDACVDVPGVKSDDPTKHGCPGDRDKDGIPDDKDACIDIPGDKSEDPKKNGCPADKDGDGIFDKDDACIDIAGVKSDRPEFNGCPVDLDSDGIENEKDACPREKGVANPDPKKNGCPAITITEKEIKIIDQVKFKTASAEILKESDVILDGVAKILKDHPEISKIRVEGHTDNVGSPAMNKTLSQRRAASVVAALVKRGVEKARLISEGYGDSKPIESNDTEAGRANNRRVIFALVEMKSKSGSKTVEVKTAPEVKSPGEVRKPTPKVAPKKK